MDITNRTFQLLADKKITAKQFAENIGVSTGNVSDWKSGRSKPNVETLCRIANYFNVSADYLLGRTDNPEVNR